jgi:hypothetical protein
MLPFAARCVPSVGNLTLLHIFERHRKIRIRGFGVQAGEVNVEDHFVGHVTSRARDATNEKENETQRQDQKRSFASYITA